MELVKVAEISKGCTVMIHSPWWSQKRCLYRVVSNLASCDVFALSEIWGARSHVRLTAMQSAVDLVVVLSATKRENHVCLGLYVLG